MVDFNRRDLAECQLNAAVIGRVPDFTETASHEARRAGHQTTATPEIIS